MNKKDKNLLKELEQHGYVFYGTKTVFSEIYIVFNIVFLFLVFLAGLFFIIFDYNNNYKIIQTNFMAGKTKRAILKQHLLKLLLLDIVLIIVMYFLVEKYLIYLYGGYIVLVLTVLVNLSLFIFNIIIILLGLNKQLDKTRRIKIDFLVHFVKYTCTSFFIAIIFFNVIDINYSIEEANLINVVYQPIKDYGYIEMDSFDDYVEYEKNNKEIVEYILASKNIEYILYPKNEFLAEDLITPVPVLVVSNELLNEYYSNSKSNTIYYSSNYNNLDVVKKNMIGYEAVELTQEIILPNLDYSSYNSATHISSEGVAIVSASNEYIKTYGNIAGGIKSNIKIKVDDIYTIKDELGTSLKYVNDFVTYESAVNQKLELIKNKINIIAFFTIILIIITLITNYFIFKLYTFSNIKIILTKCLSCKNNIRIFSNIFIMNIIFYVLITALIFTMCILILNFKIALIRVY